MADGTIQILADALAGLAWDDLVAQLPRLQPSVERLYSVPEDSFDYSHHASLGLWQGRLHAFWSNGRNGEDLPGQVQRWTSRGENGRWGSVRLLARSPMNTDYSPETTTTTNGGTAVGAPRLTSFYSECKGRPADGAGGPGK
ncbi:MAG: hypothetical protein ACYC5M_04685, partial [Anaerolineae bacterium]